jgi:glycosyltransferase involved in cell wall biosynthesis
VIDREHNEVANLRVCYFGTYESDYPRNITLIKGLRENNVIVQEIHETLWKKKTQKIRFSLLGKVSLAIAYFVAHMKLFFRGLFVSTDCYIVGYPGHFDVWIAKCVAILKRKPLVFDAFLSLYDSMVCDRKTVKKGSVTGHLLHFFDKMSCNMADRVLLDTQAHIEYFHREFGIDKEKFIRIWIGCDDELFSFRPSRKQSDFTVCFHGKFIPLQGVQYILKAASILDGKGVFFRIIGDGQTFEELQQVALDQGIGNVEFLGLLPIEDIPRHQLQCHVGLGIFGDTEKAKRVIPNKLYEIVSLRVPSITGDSEAIRELFSDGENCILCEMADAESLANAIMRLKSDNVLRERIGQGGFTLYRQNCTPKVLGKILKDEIELFIREKGREV